MAERRRSVTILRMLFTISVGVSAGAIVAGDPALTVITVPWTVMWFFDLQDSTRGDDE